METNHYDYSNAYADVVFGIFARNDILMSDGSVGIAKDSLVYTSAIDEEGHLMTSVDLPLGDYYIKELKTNDAYELNETEYDFSVTYRGPQVTAYTIQINDGEEILNELKETSIQIRKVDEADETLVLADAEFTLYDEDGNALMSVLTDENGLASFTVTQGSYSLKETKAPAGYELEETPIEVVIDEQYDETNIYEITMTNHLLPVIQTGDNVNTAIFAGLVAVSGVATAVILFKRKRETD